MPITVNGITVNDMFECECGHPNSLDEMLPNYRCKDCGKYMLGNTKVIHVKYKQCEAKWKFVDGGTWLCVTCGEEFDYRQEHEIDEEEPQSPTKKNPKFICASCMHEFNDTLGIVVRCDNTLVEGEVCPNCESHNYRTYEKHIEYEKEQEKLVEAYHRSKDSGY